MSGIVQVLACGQLPRVELAATVSNSSATGDTAYSASVAQFVYVGDRILSIWAMDNSGASGSSAFSSQSLVSSTASISLEGTRQTALNDPGAANAGVNLVCSLYKCTVPGFANLITTEFTAVTVSKAVAFLVLRGIPYTATAAITGFVSTNGVAATSATSPTLSTAPGDFVVGVGAVEARSGITADASAEWVNTTGTVLADSGTAGTSMTLIAQSYKETVYTTRDYTLTASVARDMIAAIFSIRAT